MAAWVAFLRRELALTSGRASATLRLTLACLIATIPILTHRMPFGLMVMIVMYLITQEDTAATLLGSILGVVGVTISLGLALLAWTIALDIAWLRIGLFAAFLFGGLFLKRVLSIGALGSALGLPGALAMIMPDVLTGPAGSPPPERLTELLLWLWFTVTLGLSVNLGVQLLLAPGDPLTLLHRELDTRLRVVAKTVRRLAGAADVGSPSSPSLASLATEGMSRPLALLKNASLTRGWARQRHEALAAIITQVDRLVTDASVLQMLVTSSPPDVATHTSLLRIGDACDRVREAFAERRRPAPRERDERGARLPTTGGAPLADMEEALDQIALAVRIPEPTKSPQEARPGLVLPDAFRNPEYVQFAVKGTVACLTCYILFIGFDYPGIYTSVITCFVVSLSTIGASNQKGLLRFAGAALGGLMGVVALVYAFPNVDRIGGFWLVFGAGTAVAAWINFGTPRVSYGGYQTGLAFYKAVFQSFGPAVSATVLRDRLIGIAFGLIVFGLVEHLLWPVRAADRMRARLADVLRSLAALARACSIPEGRRSGDVDAQRRLISEQVADVQGFIESSKFEPGADGPGAIQPLLGDAQTVFLVLLTIARHGDVLPPTAEQPRRLPLDAAATLEAVADHVTRGGPRPAFDLDGALATVDRDLAAHAGPTDESARATLALYRELAFSLHRLAPGDLRRQAHTG